MTLPAIIWMDRWGRRKTLIFGATAMMTFTYAIAGILAAHGSPAPPGGLDGVEVQSWEVRGAAGKASIACTYLAVAAFAISIGPVSPCNPLSHFH